VPLPQLGCFTCHGPLGKSGIKNPGAPEGEVSAWDGGNYKMYVSSPNDIREWILYGAPERKRDDPHHKQEVVESLVHMPAYEGYLTERELEDLVAFYKVVAWAEKPPSEAPEGRRVALKYGCFSCHGEGGRARQPNPGSFKGYIPSWQGGDDFAELVRDENELRLWITHGDIPRLINNPAARPFIERQRIQMPAYKDELSKQDIDRLVAYIMWLRKQDSSP
jgi:mono/diheme cytochrome c family protein